jgi:NAD(P)H-nitrite reductase large subunit
VSAVIVGGGLIGIKAVEGLVGLGVRPRVVELADRILSATFDETASQLAIELLARHGVEVLCGTTVREIGCRDGALEAVELSNGRRLPCDLLIFAIGVRPNARLAAEAGIDVGRGIVVDDRMATSAADVWAAGDVAEGTELVDGQRRPVATWPSAYSQGMVAGCNMAGGERRHGGSLAMNAVDLCGVPAIGVGRTCPGPQEPCEVLSKVDRAAGRYRKIVLREDRIIGAIFVGQIERSGIITGLIQQKIDVSHFKDSLLTDDFGVISLPAEYRKHLVSGPGMLV